jgi:cytochrome c oxidase cbb3-type subunit 3
MAQGTERDPVTGRTTTGHEWDGIKELNTPLPTWWLWTFYACIAFALVWGLLYPSLPFFGGLLGYSTRTEAAAEMQARRGESEPILARLRETDIPQILADPELQSVAVAGGRVAFANTCAACHGAGGQGAPGGFPTLVDDDWIWGGTPGEIAQTIQHGIRAVEDAETRSSLMPRFVADGMLTAAQANDVTEHALSLTNRGTDAAAATRGAVVFAENCTSCHGAQGEGGREFGAPRLNDQVWLWR